MVIAGIQKLTLLDYPGRLAATVFTPGCNLRCPFCHNAPLVEEEGHAILTDGSNIPGCVEIEDALDFLKGRRGRLTGVAVTGGEPLMQQGIEDFLRRLKDLGYDIKLDTNGSYPEKLKAVIDEGLVDYIAMDLKNSWAKYPLTTGLKDSNAAQTVISAIKQSAELLKNGPVSFEFRTTLVRELHTAQDIEEMAKFVGPDYAYFLQCFKDSGAVLRNGYSAPDEETLKDYLEIAKKYSPKTQLRGID